MKTAIIIIPQIIENGNLGMYLSACVEKVQRDGYTILHSTYWSEYSEINIKVLMNKIIHSTDAFYLFVDFGINNFMIEIVNRFLIKENGEYRFIKEIKVEIVLSVKHGTLNGFLLEISKITGFSIEALKGKTRKREIVEARQIYFTRAKLFTKASLAMIGGLVGRDHATVLHGIKQVNEVAELIRKYDDWFGEKKQNKIAVHFEPEPNKTPYKSPYKSPYASVMSSSNKGYSGFREHSL